MDTFVIFKVKLEKKCIGFVERKSDYTKKELSVIRKDLVEEIGELLPENFRFLRLEIPVSSKQENNICLEKCINKDGDESFAFSIQKVTKSEDLKKTTDRNPSTITNFTCKNCHFKGHKVSKPCDMPACTGFNECGILPMHPEQKIEINKAKQKIKDVSKKAKEKEDELESLDLIEPRQISSV